MQRYGKEFEKSMEGSEFVFDSTNLLHYILHKISLTSGRLYIDSTQKRKKKATINPKNIDNWWFQNPITVSLNYEEIKKDQQRVSKIQLFIDQYIWKEICFPSNKKDSKKIETNNKTTALSILYLLYNNEEIRDGYTSKHNSMCKNHVIIWIIADNEQ